METDSEDTRLGPRTGRGLGIELVVRLGQPHGGIREARGVLPAAHFLSPCHSLFSNNRSSGKMARQRGSARTVTQLVKLLSAFEVSGESQVCQEPLPSPPQGLHPLPSPRQQGALGDGNPREQRAGTRWPPWRELRGAQQGLPERRGGGCLCLRVTVGGQRGPVDGRGPTHSTRSPSVLLGAGAAGRFLGGQCSEELLGRCADLLVEHLPSPSCLPYPSLSHLCPPPHPPSSRPNAIRTEATPRCLTSPAGAHLSRWYKFPRSSHGLPRLAVGLGLSPGPVLVLALAGPQVLLGVACGHRRAPRCPPSSPLAPRCPCPRPRRLPPPKRPSR